MENSGIYTSVLPNGLTLVAERIPGVRSASFLILLPAGAVTDPIGQEGAATVLEGMVYRGAGERETTRPSAPRRSDQPRSRRRTSSRRSYR